MFSKRIPAAAVIPSGIPRGISGWKASYFGFPRSLAGTLGMTLIALLLTSARAAPATQPGASDNSTLEFRASQAFNRNQFGVALPLLQKLETELKDQPDKVGPVQEQIRVCQKNIALATAAMSGPQPGDPPSSAEKRKPHAAPKSGETTVMQIKDLGNFDYDADKGGNIPADVKALSGTPIKLNGFMIPMDQAQSISQFALVPSLFACCFGQPPQIQHTIIVNCPKGKAVSYFPDEIAVEGKLKVEEKKDDGFIVSIFELECSSVKPVAK